MCDLQQTYWIPARPAIVREQATMRGAGAYRRSRREVWLCVSGASCGREAVRGVGISAIRHSFTDPCVLVGIANRKLGPAGWRTISMSEWPESRSSRYENPQVLRNPAPALLTIRGVAIKLVRVKAAKDMAARGGSYVQRKGNEDNTNSDLFWIRFRPLYAGSQSVGVNYYPRQ